MWEQEERWSAACLSVAPAAPDAAPAPEGRHDAGRPVLLLPFLSAPPALRRAAD